MGGYDVGNTFWDREEQVLRPPLQKLWSYNPPDNTAAIDDVTVASGIAYLSSAADGNKQNAVFAVDALSGQHLWQFTLTAGRGAMAVPPAVSGGLVFFGGQGDDKLYAVEARTGQIQWTVSGLSDLYSQSPKVAGGVLFANGIGGPILALDPQSGHKLWELPDMGRQSDIAIEGGVLLQGSTFGEPLTGIDTVSGKVIWQTPGRTKSYVAAWNGLAYVPYSGDSPSKLQDYPFYKYDRVDAFHVNDGTKAWETVMPETITYSPMAVSGDALYLVNRGDADSTVYVLDLSTGKIMNQRVFSEPIGRLISANGVLYTCSYKGPIYALEPDNLNTLWISPDVGCFDLATANGRLYVVYYNQLIVYGNS